MGERCPPPDGGSNFFSLEKPLKGLARIVQSDAMPVIRDAFARQYPDTRLSDTKMVDFVLWQIRETD